jgi:hypothetical protein
MPGYNTSMNYANKIGSCFIIHFCLANPVLAENTIEASTRLLNFNYEEFDESGRSLNKETGVIPGLSISSANTLKDFTSAFSFEFYSGDVDYDGQTQAGAPHTTTTDETQYRLFYMLAWSPEAISSSLYGKIIWQQWDRDIAPANNVAGLYEQYRWWAFEAGILTTLYDNGMDTWQFELGASKVNNGTIKIDLETYDFGQPTLDLGTGSGLSTAIKYKHQMPSQDDIGLSLEYRYWTFGRSNTETISNSFSSITITEPRSVSKQAILSVVYRHYF